MLVYWPHDGDKSAAGDRLALTLFQVNGAIDVAAILMRRLYSYVVYLDCATFCRV